MKFSGWPNTSKISTIWASNCKRKGGLFNYRISCFTWEKWLLNAIIKFALGTCGPKKQLFWKPTKRELKMFTSAFLVSRTFVIKLIASLQTHCQHFPLEKRNVADIESSFIALPLHPDHGTSIMELFQQNRCLLNSNLSAVLEKPMETN